MFTMIGKNEIRKAVRMAGPAPMPNQTTRMGTNAALGSALKAGHQGIDRGVGDARAADDEAQQHADDDRQAEAGHGDPEGAPGMAPR